MKHVDPLKRLKLFVAAHPNRRAAASALDIKEPYLSELLNGKRPISEHVLTGLGLQKHEIVGERAK